NGKRLQAGTFKDNPWRARMQCGLALALELIYPQLAPGFALVLGNGHRAAPLVRSLAFGEQTGLARLLWGCGTPGAAFRIDVAVEQCGGTGAFGIPVGHDPSAGRFVRRAHGKAAIGALLVLGLQMLCLA